VVVKDNGEKAVMGAIREEILSICKEYHAQVDAHGYIDTPGGLEHMGDVWRLLLRWEQMIKKDME
jgi:hypothetical protein